ncbi:hypothetical protein GGI04_003720 [Coemansia thaxteri]|nr:hypothetical protein GGI04_003720 [Coemansia thaxteri]
MEALLSDDSSNDSGGGLEELADIRINDDTISVKNRQVAAEPQHSSSSSSALAVPATHLANGGGGDLSSLRVITGRNSTDDVNEYYRDASDDNGDDSGGRWARRNNRRGAGNSAKRTVGVQMLPGFPSLPLSPIHKSSPILSLDSSANSSSRGHAMMAPAVDDDESVDWADFSSFGSNAIKRDGDVVVDQLADMLENVTPSSTR